MKTPELIAARKKAEESVSDMAEGPLKVTAFQVILSSLLSSPAPNTTKTDANEARLEEPRRGALSSVAQRIELLAEEQFFTEPRSLSEIQTKLAEHGWHYPQTNLSTPLIRLVRQRRLRRLPIQVGNKRVWKYALP
jgi:hypothetical protein